MSDAPAAPCGPVTATDAPYIRYTSGTTWKPKGVVRDRGAHAVVLHRNMRNIYDARPGDVHWAASDVGWVFGHCHSMHLSWLPHGAQRG